MARLLGTTFRGWIGTATQFISGFTGQGWRLWKHKIANGVGRYKLEIDDLMVRGTMVIFELIISKIRAIKGALGITQACGKIKAVRFLENYYYIKIEDEMCFMQDDYIRCQKFNTSSTALKGYWVKISSINSDDELVIPFSEFMSGADVGEYGFPEVGDDIVQFGNKTNKARQSAIYLHAEEGGVPAIDVLQGINSKTFEGCTRVKLGGFTDELKSYFGLYCVNGMIKSVAEDGVTELYKLRPDGSGFLAKGNITWAADGSGYLCKTTVGGQTKYAITWDENGLTLGSNVTIRWENLSTETQQKLTGDKTEFRYAEGLTAPALLNTSRTPASWNLAASTPLPGQYIWMTWAIIKNDNTLRGTWATAVRISGNSAPAAKPQYSTDATSWHDTFAQGDIWMRLSVDGGTTYGSAVRIVGEKGDIGADGKKQIYYKYDFSYSSSLSGTPTGVTWVDAPPAAVAGQYLWMRTTIYTPKADNSGWDAGTPTYSRLGGENGSNGASPYALDLTNENVSLPATSAGVVLDYSTAFTNFNLYLGSSIVSAAYSIVASSGVTATLDSANKKITVTELITDTATVTLYAKNGDGTITYGTAVFTLSKVKNGESSVIYSLLPLVSAIKRGKDGATIPLSITCSKLKRVGSADPSTTTEMSLVYTTSANATEKAYSGAITIGATWTWIEFILKNGTTVLDRERVPIVKDGSDGIDGIDGIDGDSPYQLVLSNQMASITLNADGTLNYSDAVTTPTLYCGLQAVPDVTYNFTAQDGVAASMTSGAISVTSVTNEYTNLEITATLQGGSTPIAKVLFKVVKVKSAIAYQIIPSVTSVKKTKAGVYSVDTVLFNVYRIVGGVRTQVTNVTTDQLKIRFLKDGSTSSFKVVDGYNGNSYDFADAYVNTSSITSFVVAQLYPNKATWNEADLLDTQTVPILIDGNDGNPGADANLLPWVQDWNSNQTEVGSDHLISPKIFSGTKNATTGALTGVALGREVVVINGVAKTGVFGIKDGVLTFSIDDDGNVSGDGRFSAGNSSGKIILDPSQKAAILYNSYDIIVGRLAFEEINGVTDYSASRLELYTYVDGAQVKRIKISSDQISMMINGVSILNIKQSPIGTFSNIHANLPEYPTVPLNDIPTGDLFVDANSSYVVKVRHT